jgi:hypothetical protein
MTASQSSSVAFLPRALLALIVPESWVPPKENDISILRRGHAAHPAEGLSATYSARSAMTGSTRVARREGT